MDSGKAVGERQWIASSLRLVKRSSEYVLCDPGDRYLCIVSCILFRYSLVDACVYIRIRAPKAFVMAELATLLKVNEI